MQDVVVIGVPDDDFGERAHAFVELKPGQGLSGETLLAFVADKLASYKRPKHISFVDQLPRNAMGKITKSELRSPFWAGRERAV